MPDQHELSAFAEVLNSAEKPILVGGQAVNLWAEHYASAIPALDPLRPFMSKDADIFGDRAMADRLAVATNWRLTCYNEPRTIAIAMLTKDVPGKDPLLIEVINSVNGLTSNDLLDPDILELRPGQVYRVPSPVILLKAKLANASQLDQTRRQDVRHVQMLIPCVCEYPALGPTCVSADESDPEPKEGRSSQIPEKGKHIPDWSLDDFLHGQTPPAKDRELEL